MTYYKREVRGTAKWLLAMILFILVMSVTWTDVYGVGHADGTSKSDVTYDNANADYSGTDAGTHEGTTPPRSIPEPATLILLGSGLSALYIVRRKRNLQK